MYAPDPDDKFDYQNMDVKLYLALRAVLANREDPILIEAAVVDAERAMYEFTNSFGPIPDWAVDRNWDYSLVPGAQLCTKDGRRTGNAHIIKATALMYGLVGESLVYECLTDAGSKFTFTEVELLGAFTIGDWISNPVRVLKDFDREGHFDTQGE